jgi:hypothetical protein
MILVLGTGIAPLAAGEAWTISQGRNIGTVVSVETRELADGSTYMTGRAKVAVETEDPSYPITGEAMECTWMCRVPADGGDGACVMFCSGVDKDGDLFSFVAEAWGAGTYTVGPGTGKYVGATGGGTFAPVTLSDPALSYNTWEGTLELK